MKNRKIYCLSLCLLMACKTSIKPTESSIKEVENKAAIPSKENIEVSKSALDLSNYQLIEVYENTFSNNQEIAFEEDLIEKQADGSYKRIKTPTKTAEWIAEGWGDAQVKSGKLWVAPYPFDEQLNPVPSADKKPSHMVLWNKQVFPANFLLEFTVNHCNSDNGLTLFFFCATGNKGEDIFDINLPPRRANYRNYNRGAIANYTDSYWSRNKNGKQEELTNRIRKNPGFKQVSSGESRTNLVANKDYKLRLLKVGNSIKIEMDGVVINEWIDTETPHGSGRIGLRSMKGVTKVAYDDFKVWEVLQNTAPIHLGQGMMAGEIADKTAILQTRLTQSDSLVDGHLKGQKGSLQFQYYEKGAAPESSQVTEWMEASSRNDFIIKTKIKGLKANQVYAYKAFYGQDTLHFKTSKIHHFRTNPGKESTDSVSFAVVTGMNYYHFHYGKYEGAKRYKGADKHLGYPALANIKKLAPDYFIGTGDNVYFDHPAEKGFKKAQKAGKNPLPGLFDGKEVVDEAGMRRKYHVQFVQPRFKDLFQNVGTYWEKDDHDHRVNDSDPYMDFPISHELGLKNFREQLPVVDPKDKSAVTYRTYQLSKDVQIWLLEGRDYRSRNKIPDSPNKTIWGATQKAWLKKTLLESTATFKLVISPTPMVGPDDAYKTDNHVNHEGFRIEGDAFYQWLGENDFLNKNFYFICGDRHWQYHAINPSGFEEFSTGALVDNNSRAGRLAGDPKSTDPNSLIRQPYIQGTKESASGGFLLVKVDRTVDKPRLRLLFYDEKGTLLYEEIKNGQ